MHYFQGISKPLLLHVTPPLGSPRNGFDVVVPAVSWEAREKVVWLAGCLQPVKLPKEELGSGRHFGSKCPRGVDFPQEASGDQCRGLQITKD